MFDSKLFEKVSINVSPEVANSFDDLDRDEYFANGIRKRRFCQLKMSHSGDAWNFEKLPLRPFLQPKLTAFMHRSLIMGACRRVVGFFEKPAQGDPPRRFSVAEMV